MLEGLSGGMGGQRVFGESHLAAISGLAKGLMANGRYLYFSDDQASAI